MLVRVMIMGGRRTYPSSSCGKGHSNITNVKRESFGTVGEWHRSFSGTVDCHESVDCSSDASKLSLRRNHGLFRWNVRARNSVGVYSVGNQKGETGPEETQRHQREGRQEQVSSSEGVDGVDGRNSEQEVHDTSSQRYKQGVRAGETGVLEDLRAVVGDNVDTT